MDEEPRCVNDLYETGIRALTFQAFVLDCCAWIVLIAALFLLGITRIFAIRSLVGALALFVAMKFIAVAAVRRELRSQLKEIEDLRTCQLGDE